MNTDDQSEIENRKSKMVITNATIIRIDTLGAYDQSIAARPLVAGAAITLRCSWQDPKSGRKWVLGAAVKDATAVLYLDGNQESLFTIEGQVVVLVDGETTARTYKVLGTSPQIGLGLDNTEVYLA